MSLFFPRHSIRLSPNQTGLVLIQELFIRLQIGSKKKKSPPLIRYGKLACYWFMNTAKQTGCVQPDAIELGFSIWRGLPLSCCWHREQNYCFMEMCKSYQSNLAKPIQKTFTMFQSDTHPEFRSLSLSLFFLFFFFLVLFLYYSLAMILNASMRSATWS